MCKYCLCHPAGFFSSVVVGLVIAGLLAPTASGTTYYVKNGGNDGDLGTSDTEAWRTVDKVNGYSFAAGDVIKFKRGHKWAEALVVPRGDITIESYDTGQLPILGYTDEISAGDPGWSLSSGQTYTYERSFTGSGYYEFMVERNITSASPVYQHIPLLVETSVARVEAADGSFYWDDANDTLYVNPYGNADPADCEYFLRNGTQAGGSSAISVNSKDNVELRDLYATCSVYGLLAANSNNLKVASCSFVGNYNYGAYLAFCSDSQVTDSKAIHDGNGFRFWHFDGGTVSGCTVGDIESVNDYSTLSTRAGIAVVDTDGADVTGNEVYDTGTAVEIIPNGGTSTDINVSLNYIYGDFDAGVALTGTGTLNDGADSDSYSLSVSQNVIWNSDPLTGTSAGIEILNSIVATSSHQIGLYNNTVHATYNFDFLGNATSHCVMYNNLSYDPGSYHIRNAYESEPNLTHTRNYNLYYPLDASHPICWGPASSTTLAAYQSASDPAQEQESIDDDPDLRLTGSPIDVRPNLRSPALKAGTSEAPDFLLDFYGHYVNTNAPSIGAAEAGETYFVRDDGNDTRDGTPESEAWATVAELENRTFEAGDTIAFRYGDRWAETLNVPRGDIKITAYYGPSISGGLPMFGYEDCLPPGTTTWTQKGTTNVYWTSCPAVDGHGVERYLVQRDGEYYRRMGNYRQVVNQDGKKVWTRFTHEDQLEDYPGGFFWSLNRLYVHAFDSANPTDEEYLLQYGPSNEDVIGIHVNGKDNVTLQNLHAVCCNRGINVEDSDFAVIDSCMASGNRARGIRLAGSITANCEHGTIKDCRVRFNGNGIALTRVNHGEAYGCVVSEVQTLTSAPTNCHPCDTEAFTLGWNSNDVHVHHNTVYDVGSAIETYSGNPGLSISNIVVSHNFINGHFGTGIRFGGAAGASYEDGSDNDGYSALAYYNVIYYDDDANGLGHGVAIGNQINNHTDATIGIFNNTIHASKYSFYFSCPEEGDPNSSADNICGECQCDAYVDMYNNISLNPGWGHIWDQNADPSGFDRDNNIYYPIDTLDVSNKISWARTWYTALGLYVNASKMDDASLDSDPDLYLTGTYPDLNFRPDPSLPDPSPAIGAGADKLPSVLTDFYDQPIPHSPSGSPSIGAAEPAP